MDENWLDKARLLDKSAEVHTVDGWLNGDTAVAPVIADRKRPYAIVHTRSILGRNLNGPTHLNKVAWPVPTLTPDEPEASVIAKFADSTAPYLPVCQGNKLAGVVHASRVAGSLNAPTRYDTSAAALAPDASMQAAAKAFASTTAAQLPVVEGGRVVGLLRRQTVLQFQSRSAQPRDRLDRRGELMDLSAEPVSGHMDGAWMSCGPLGDIGELLREAGYAIVVEGGLFKGMVTPISTLRAWVDTNTLLAT